MVTLFKKYWLYLLGVILVVYHGYVLIHTGYFRDEYPSIYMSLELMEKIWTAFFCSIVFMSLVSIVQLINKKNLTIFLYVVMAMFLIFSATVSYEYYNLTKGYPLGQYEKSDYIPEKWLHGISLQEFDKYFITEEFNILYVGRNDCKACKDFEKELVKIAEETSSYLPTYYTNQDRDDNQEEMYTVLEKYAVESVPTLLICDEKGNVLERITEPENLEILRKYLYK